MDLNGRNLMIVADQDYFPMLFTYRNQNPQARIKIISKDEVIDKLGFTFKKDPIPFLMKEGIEFNKAKKWIRLLRSADYRKNEKLQGLYEKLKDEYLTKDDYGTLELSRYEVLLFEMDEDSEIHSLLRRNGIAHADLHVSEIDCVDFYNEKDHPDIYDFQNKYAQYFYIFSDIKRRIKNDPAIKDGITIQMKDEFDLFYTELFSKTFKIPVYGTLKKTFISIPQVKAKVDGILSSRSFAFSREELNSENLKELYSLILQYDLESLDFDFAYINLLEILNSHKLSFKTGDRGITLTSGFTFHQSPYTYVTDFQYDVFYKVSMDQNVLSDEELISCGMNPSYQETLLDKRKKKNYIFYTNIVFLSRVLQHLNESIYDSQFIGEFGWKDSVLTKDMNPEGLYTSDAKLLYNINEFDRKFYMKQDGKLNSYDHSFKGLNKSIIKPGKIWSLTNLETYINCPFQYYLKMILPLEEDDYTARWRGTMIHSLMEDINHDDFDFDVSYQRARDAYVEEVKKAHMEMTPKDEVTLEVLKYWLSRIIPAIRKNYEDNCHFISNKDDKEKEIEFSISSDDGTVTKNFRGYIDKIVWSEHDGAKYYTIIDYKTGHESFKIHEVFLGKSVQLPLYYHAVSNHPDSLTYTGGGEFGGFGIQHNYFPSIKEAYKDIKGLSGKHLLSESRIRGLTKDDLFYWLSMDSSGVEEEKNKGKAVLDSFGKPKLKLKTYGGSLLGYEPFHDPDDPKDKLCSPDYGIKKYNFKDMLDDARHAMLDTIDKIEKSEFRIAPTSFSLEHFDKDRLACEFCKYKDICYHKKSDAVDYSKVIDEHFKEKKEETENAEEQHEI